MRAIAIALSLSLTAAAAAQAANPAVPRDTRLIDAVKSGNSAAVADFGAPNKVVAAKVGDCAQL